MSLSDRLYTTCGSHNICASCPSRIYSKITLPSANGVALGLPLGAAISCCTFPTGSMASPMEGGSTPFAWVALLMFRLGLAGLKMRITTFRDYCVPYVRYVASTWLPVVESSTPAGFALAFHLPAAPDLPCVLPLATISALGSGSTRPRQAMHKHFEIYIFRQYIAASTLH